MICFYFIFIIIFFYVHVMGTEEQLVFAVKLILAQCKNSLLLEIDPTLARILYHSHPAQQGNEKGKVEGG